MNIDLEKFIGETIGGDAGKHPTFFQAPSPNTTGATTMDENGEPYVYDLQAFELDTAWETSNEGFRDRFTEVQHLTSSMPRFVLEGTVLSLADHFGEETVLAIINRFVANGLIPDDNEIIEMLDFREDLEVAVTSTEGRCLVFHTAALAPKTTRATQGVNVMTLKPKWKVERARPLAETAIVNAARYRARSLPAAGALLKEEDRGEEQLSLL